jgi:hypothetical protein
MKTKLALIAELSEKLAECRYQLGTLAARPANGMSLGQTTELLGHVRQGRNEDAIAVLRQCFRLSAEDAALILVGGTYHASVRPP